MKRILVVRVDRIGDSVLSTPAIAMIQDQIKDTKITYVVRPEIKPIFEGLVDEVWPFESLGRFGFFESFLKLVAEIRKKRFDAALILQNNRILSAAIYAAGVPVRVGPYSHPLSFLTFNHGLRQRRSRSEKNEAEYGLDLAKVLMSVLGETKLVSLKNYTPKVSLSSEAVSRARDSLLEMGWSSQLKTVVVHPGMGGSALNWPEKYYLQLIEALARGFQVVVTAGAADGDLLERYRGALAQTKNLQGQLFFWTDKNAPSGLSDFLGVLSLADLVIAPSTGPLHLAAALGKRVISFYPPITVQNVKRWGPYGAPNATVFTPEVKCGAIFTCMGARCHDYPCMEKISVREVLEKARL